MRACCCLYLVLLVLAAGCSSRKDSERLEGVKVDFKTDPDPPRVGPVKTSITLKDKEGKPIEGAVLELEGNMNHAGMKPVFADARETDPGRYEAELKLTMGGDWFVLITGKLADGRKVKEKVDMPGVKSR
jgi:hypothetical protein